MVRRGDQPRPSTTVGEVTDWRSNNRRYDQTRIDMGEMVSLVDMPNLEYQQANILPHISGDLQIGCK